MKILHWAFVLIAIVLPFSIICKATINSRFAELKDEVRINNVIDTATKDAIDQIIAVSGFNFDEEFGEVINITPELAQECINTFFHTLAINYSLPYKISDKTEVGNISSDSDIKNYFAPYVPAVVVIAYDGFYVYSQDLIKGSGYEYRLSSKIPYTKNYGNFSVGYTLGNDIYFYYNDKCYSGKLKYNTLAEISNEYNTNYVSLGISSLDDISAVSSDMGVMLYSLAYGGIPGAPNATDLKYLLPSNTETEFLKDYDNEGNVGPFNKERRSVIIKTITECLRQEINVEHNRFANMMGSTYEFYLPEMNDNNWVNTINDISVMSFVQGIPIGNLQGTYYNGYALGGSQIVERDYIYGDAYFNNKTGKTTNLYHKKDCELVKDKLDDCYIFITEEQALQNGFLPCQKCH